MGKRCRNCGEQTKFETDLSAGTVTCLECGAIVESDILVNEVGFAEGAGGRVHAQGTFVSDRASGLGGFQGRSSAESSEQVKADGRERIRLLADRMGITFSVKNSASRLFDLAVAERFNRGRRKEYVIASCLYLASRLKRESYMLIDFSERLRINVYELGSTYLKLRTTLNLNEPMPEVDPAIYNIRFAHRLSYGDKTSTVAADASRLVRRFRADWMTQGRRPAGVCGACLILASRMNNFLRTPEEVAQVVKVSPVTIRKRLMEFAGTEMAGKTVKEWREMRDEELERGTEEPPVMKAARVKAEMIKVETLRRVEEEKERDGEEGEDGDDGSTLGKRKRGRGVWSGRERDETVARDIDGLIQAAAEEYAVQEEEEEDSDDPDLGALEKGEHLDALKTTVQETPEEREQRIADARAFKRSNKANTAVDYEALAELVEAEGEGGEEEEDVEVNYDDDEDAHEKENDGQGEDLNEDEEDGGDGDGDGEEADENPRPRKRREPFTDWSDPEAVIAHMTDTYFGEEKRQEIYTSAVLRKRVEAFINNRDPQIVAKEMDAIKLAKRDADIYRRTCKTGDLTFDLDVEQELDRVHLMGNEEKLVRGRMWLSINGKWMEQDQARQMRTAAYNKAHNIDPSKPKPKKKRAMPHRGPYKSARDAIQGMSVQKKFSKHVDLDALKRLGLDAGEDYDGYGVTSMGDEKEDEKGDNDEKGDEGLFTGQEEYDPYDGNYGGDDIEEVNYFE